jgi:hypothetical protein
LFTGAKHLFRFDVKTFNHLLHQHFKGKPSRLQLIATVHPFIGLRQHLFNETAFSQNPFITLQTVPPFPQRLGLTPAAQATDQTAAGQFRTLSQGNAFFDILAIVSAGT